MKKIKLTKNQLALVDDEDYEYLSLFSWQAQRIGNGKYRTITWTKRPNRTFLRMHTLIMNPPRGMEVDHIDGNPLNNQKSNLRICTHANNMLNRSKEKGNTTGYKGVSFQKNRYISRIRVNNKEYWIGSFDSPEDAAKAYDDAARIYHGEFAKLNFP